MTKHEEAACDGPKWISCVPKSSASLAKTGFALSLIATVAYVVIYIVIMIDPSISIPLNPILLLLYIALAPLLAMYVVVGLIVVIMMIVAFVLICVGKTKVGGILMIVFSCIGVGLALFAYFIPMAIGITAGIISIVVK